MVQEPLLKIKDLAVSIKEEHRDKPLLRGLNFEIEKHMIVALVGGSGSGKTTTGLSILRLLPAAFSITGGQILFEGRDLLGLTESQMRGLRGKEIGMVFQEPLNAFNPVLTIGSQIEEVLVFHSQLTRSKIQEKVWELLDIVGVPDPRRIAKSYPHQLSGGLRQRSMIAQAIAAMPKLIIADEPTSNLDVTLQAHIIELFKKLKRELNISILLITHDLGMVEHLADETVIIADGQAVEAGKTLDVLKSPKHSFTRQLMNALAI